MQDGDDLVATAETAARSSAFPTYGVRSSRGLRQVQVHVCQSSARTPAALREQNDPLADPLGRRRSRAR